MTRKTVIAMAAVALLAVACKPEAPPLPAQVQPMPQVPVAAVPQPTEPIVVFASAEPAHGGVTQKIGDYMVELATGGEGKVHFHVQKFEGATPAFDSVQLEVMARPTGSEIVDQTVVFYPKDGKLEGTVAGMSKIAYDFGVAIYEIGTTNLAVGTFRNIEVEPLATELEAKHDGTVQLVDKTKVEVVAKGKTLLLYLRDLQDNNIPPSASQVEDVDVEVGEGESEKVALEPVGDHYEGEIGAELPEAAPIRIVNAKLVFGGETYDRLRIPRLTRWAKLPQKKAAAGPTPPPMTQTEAKQVVPGAGMRGSIGSMKVGAPPAAAAKPAQPAAGEGTAPSKKKGTSGPVTQGKKGQ